MSGFDFNAYNAQIAARNAEAAAAAGVNSVELVHAGQPFIITLEGDAQTVLEIIQRYGSNIGVPADVVPNVTRPGSGTVDVRSTATPGRYEIFTDRKENA